MICGCYQVGDRVVVTDPGDEYHGEWGTVTVAEYPAVLSGRRMVEVRLDGQSERFDTGYYLDQLELAPTFSPTLPFTEDAHERTGGGDEAHRPCVAGVSRAAREADRVRASHPPLSDGACTVRVASDPDVRHVSTEAVGGIASSAPAGLLTYPATCPACRGTGGGVYNDCPSGDGNGVV